MAMTRCCFGISAVRRRGCRMMTISLVPMREALRRPEYFGDVVAGDSWENLRVLFIAIAGEQLDY
jgi:hypothetical protein